MPQRNIAKDIEAGSEFLAGDNCAIDIIRILSESGFNDIADNLLKMQKERIVGDYLQVSSIFDENNHVISGLNNPNNYSGPGTGYQMSPERWKKLSDKTSALEPENILEIQRNLTDYTGLYKVKPSGSPIHDGADIIVALSPGFCDLKLGVEVCKSHLQVLKNVVTGIEEKGMNPQIVKVYSTDNIVEIARQTSAYSRYSISIALQINGRVYISDGRRETDDEIRGYYKMVMSSPDMYKKLGHLAVNFALDTGYENNGIHMRGNFTEYQLRMVKLPTSEKEFVKDYKGMEVLQFE